MDTERQKETERNVFYLSRAYNGKISGQLNNRKRVHCLCLVSCVAPRWHASRVSLVYSVCQHLAGDSDVFPRCQCIRPCASCGDVHAGMLPWSLRAPKDKVWVLGPGLGLETLSFPQALKLGHVQQYADHYLKHRRNTENITGCIFTQLFSSSFKY